MIDVIYSAIGPNVKAGKKAKAAINRMTPKVIKPKVDVSVFKVPALSGMYFFLAKSPAIATGPIIGKYLDKIKTIPVEIFHHGVLAFNPAKPDPLFAEAEVN